MAECIPFNSRCCFKIVFRPIAVVRSSVCHHGGEPNITVDFDHLLSPECYRFQDYHASHKAITLWRVYWPSVYYICGYVFIVLLRVHSFFFFVVVVVLQTCFTSVKSNWLRLSLVNESYFILLYTWWSYLGENHDLAVPNSGDGWVLCVGGLIFDV